MNNPNSWFQLALFVGLLVLITKPLGVYLVRVLDARGETFIDRLVKPFERATYWICGIDRNVEQDWILSKSKHIPEHVEAMRLALANELDSLEQTMRSG